MEGHNMINDIARVLLTEEELDALTTKIAEQIDRDYSNREKRLLLLGILKGSVVFMSDLMKKIKRPVEIDFMKVSSYGAGTETTGKINIILDLHRTDLSETDILVIEDIIDS
ncbi:MAG: hypoxanthine phosphoribosyltransferase, partial [Clostridia bacterium]|nr:hypoxanthine phosphoribosyltransferase [Clostridia bacterium]